MKEAIKKSLLDRNGPSISQDSNEDDQDDVQERSPMIQTKSRSEEKGVYVAGMLKIGEKKLFIVVSGLFSHAFSIVPTKLTSFFLLFFLSFCRTSRERCMNRWRAVYWTFM